MNGREGNWMQRFCRENLMKRDHLKDQGIDGRITLKWLFKK